MASTTLNANALCTEEALRKYVTREWTDDRSGQLAAGSLAPLVNRMSSAIASYLDRLTMATTAYAFTAAVNDTLTTTSTHGLAVGDTVILHNPLSGSLPTGLAERTLYYVKTAATTTTLTLSLTSGGAAVDVTAAGSGGYVAKATQYLLPGEADAILRLYRHGEYPLIDIASLTLQTSSETVPYRTTVNDSGWFLSDTDYAAGIVRLDGYSPGRDPHEVLMYARCGFCPIEAQRSGLKARHHRQALDDLENACLQWGALLFKAPVPSAETMTVDGSSFMVTERDIPPRVRLLLDPYRYRAMGVL